MPDKKFKLSKKKLLRGSLVVLGVFIVVNLLVGIVYAGKTYPKTSVAGKAVGSVPLGELSRRANQLSILPKQVTLTYEKQKATASTEQLGVSVDGSKLKTAAAQNRTWLPLLNLLGTRQLSAQLAVNTKVFNEYTKTIEPIFKKDPVSAKLEAKDGTFSLVKDQAGYILYTTKLKDTVMNGLDSGQAKITVPVKATTAPITAADLEKPLKTVNGQLDNIVTFVYNGQSKTPDKAERAGWFVAQDKTYVMSADAVKDSIVAAGKAFGIAVSNTNEAAAAAIKVVQTGTREEITLMKLDPTKTYTYCVSPRGVTEDLGPLKAKLAQTYADPRGWSLNGRVHFVEVAANCNFTVWLSAASQMSTFGAICDSDWSCRIGDNVVLNADRWNGASAAWNAAGLGLDDYRSMVINHETGHWFGFNHSNCPGAGQPAPIMQQQSISLQGCAFNPWPLPSELAYHQRSIGL